MVEHNNGISPPKGIENHVEASSQRNRKCDLRGITKPRAPICLPPANMPEGNHTSATPRITSESAIAPTGITPRLVRQN